MSGRLIENEENEMLHSGLRYNTSAIDMAVADDASLCLGIDLKGNNHLHAIIGADSAGDCEFYFFEDATFTGGTEETPKNTNRVYGSDTVTASFMHNPTITATGIRLSKEALSGGPYQTAVHTRLLDKDKKYLVKMINRTGGAAAIDIRCDFWLYE